MRHPRGPDPLTLRIARLAGALEALGEGRTPHVSLLDHWLDWLREDGSLGEFSELDALSASLDRLGLHTAAEMRLLLRLAVSPAPLEKITEGLARRCERACDELERALRRAAHRQRIGAPIPGAVRTLEAQLGRLQRLAQVAAACAEGAQDHSASAPLLPPGVGQGAGESAATGRSSSKVGAHRDPGPPRLALARMLEARAQRPSLDSPRRRRDLELARALLRGIEPGPERAEVLALRWRLAQPRDFPAARDGSPSPGPGAVGLLREVRGLALRDPAAAWRALHGLYARAVLAGRSGLASAGLAALEALVPDPVLLRERLSRRLQELEEGRVASHPEARLRALMLGLPADRARLLDLARGCARFFELEEGRLGDAEVDGVAPAPERPRRVRWPTRRLALETTGSPDRAHDFVIQDPRRVLHDLASQQQAVRSWLEESPRPAPEASRRSSVRVYVCDASGSMHGARARFRDALLVAELESIVSKGLVGVRADPLYYCYFSDRPTSLRRVEGADEALGQLEQILARTPAAGPTDITLALSTAFETVLQARGLDPRLGRAEVVLVTDGEDRIDVDRIQRARGPLTGLAVSLSFIALGHENPDLRQFARAQREEEGRAFYTHLDDVELLWARTAFETPFRTLLPEEPGFTLDPARIDRGELERRLQALEKVAVALDAEVAGFGPMPVPPGRFERLFPRRLAAAGARVDQEAVDRVLRILEALEVTAPLVPLRERADECVRLLEHLCDLYGMTASQWLEALVAAGERSAASLRRLRLLANPLRD